MRFLKNILPVLISAVIMSSCSVGNPEAPKESTARILTSESGYTLRVERGSGRIEITSPEELCGVVFTFTDTESYLESGEMNIPLSADSAAPFKDYLVMAYPEDHTSGGESSFDLGGASFNVEYRDGQPVAVTVDRGGVERSVTIVEG